MKKIERLNREIKFEEPWTPILIDNYKELYMEWITAYIWVKKIIKKEKKVR